MHDDSTRSICESKDSSQTPGFQFQPQAGHRHYKEYIKIRNENNRKKITKKIL